MNGEERESALVKDALGPAALRAIADVGVRTSSRFDRAAFLEAASRDLVQLSIMQRVRHVADALRQALPDHYLSALAIIRKMVPQLAYGFQAVAVTEYVARFGLDEFDESLSAIADLTRYGTGEFAVRPFMVADIGRTIKQMERWTRHENEHVRRLASEGSRPRLPWAPRVPALNDDPTLGARILEALKSDGSAYVRKSVANHLNDIAKDRPQWVVERLESWSQDNAATRWVVRHALRTLIKQGNVRALALIGAQAATAVDVMNFSVSPSIIELGENVTIEVDLISRGASSQMLVVDYRVVYVRAGDRTASKVFKLKTFSMDAGARVKLKALQPIRNFSTRTHYPGIHRLELLVNGAVMASSSFELRTHET